MQAHPPHPHAPGEPRTRPPHPRSVWGGHTPEVSTQLPQSDGRRSQHASLGQTLLCTQGARPPGPRQASAQENPRLPLERPDTGGSVTDVRKTPLSFPTLLTFCLLTGWWRCSLLAVLPGGRQALNCPFVLPQSWPQALGAPGALFISPFRVHKSSKGLVIKFSWLQFARDSLSFRHCLAALKHYTPANGDFGLTRYAGRWPGAALTTPGLCLEVKEEGGQ